MKNRSYAFDNLKCFLIYCVVFGHMLALVPENNTTAYHLKELLYYLIYSFHMPVFIFISGFFAKFSLKKIVELFMYYVVFQIIYYIMFACILGEDVIFQLHTPYYTLWYLVTLAIYLCSVWFLKRVPNVLILPFVVVSFLLSISAGYCQNIDEKYSLSRTLVFFPFFTLGYFTGRYKDKFLESIAISKRNAIIILILAVLIACLCCNSGVFVGKMLWGAFPYTNGYGQIHRIVILLNSLLWIMGILALFKHYLDFYIPYITAIGKNTFSIFLLHGYIVKSLLLFIRTPKILYLALFSGVLVFVLGYRKCFEPNENPNA